MIERDPIWEFQRSAREEKFNDLAESWTPKPIPKKLTPMEEFICTIRGFYLCPPVIG